MSRLDPTTWIDQQRAAGDRRGNIFADILAECARVRAERHGVLSQAWIDRRVTRVEDIRREAMAHDSDADVVRERPPIPTFTQMMDRWKRS